MGLDNNLNVSELLRRLGVKGDSLGSAPLLESLRLTLNIGDLSELVPPVAAPHGGAALTNVSGVGTFNKWSMRCLAPGGARILMLTANPPANYRVWISPTNEQGAVAATIVGDDFSFEQFVQSEFRVHVPIGAIAGPPGAFIIQGTNEARTYSNFHAWVGPGEFFNIESEVDNTNQTVSIFWQEYPGALNP